MAGGGKGPIAAVRVAEAAQVALGRVVLASNGSLTLVGGGTASRGVQRALGVGSTAVCLRHGVGRAESGSEWGGGIAITGNLRVVGAESPWSGAGRRRVTGRRGSIDMGHCIRKISARNLIVK